MSSKYKKIRDTVKTLLSTLSALSAVELTHALQQGEITPRIDTFRAQLKMSFLTLSVGFDAVKAAENLLAAMPIERDCYHINMLEKLLQLYDLFVLLGIEKSHEANLLNELYQAIETKLEEQAQATVQSLLAACKRYKTYLQSKINHPNANVEQNYDHYLPKYQLTLALTDCLKDKSLSAMERLCNFKALNNKPENIAIFKMEAPADNVFVKTVRQLLNSFLPERFRFFTRSEQLHRKLNQTLDNPPQNRFSKTV
jgi:hypothetical protein